MKYFVVQKLIKLFSISIIFLVFVFVGCKQSVKKSDWQEEILSLFNGKNLDGWKGDSSIWSVEEGCIVGRTTSDKPIEQNTFLIHNTSFSDFELSFQYKIIGGNSGVQYRAKVLDKELFIVGGYQADMEAGNNYSGILYEEKGRGILALRGEQVRLDSIGIKTVTKFANSETIESRIQKEQWNEYLIVANGNHLQHFINGVKSVDVVDDEVDKKASSGIIALQVHKGPEMTVYYKDLHLKLIKN